MKKFFLMLCLTNALTHGMEQPQDPNNPNNTVHSSSNQSQSSTQPAQPASYIEEPIDNDLTSLIIALCGGLDE